MPVVGLEISVVGLEISVIGLEISVTGLEITGDGNVLHESSAQHVVFIHTPYCSKNTLGLSLQSDSGKHARFTKDVSVIISIWKSKYSKVGKQIISKHCVPLSRVAYIRVLIGFMWLSYRHSLGLLYRH